MLDKVVGIILEVSLELIELAVAKKGLFLGIAVAFGLLFLGIVFHPSDIDYPKGGMTPAHQRNLAYLLEASRDHTPGFIESTGGFSGHFLPVVNEGDFPQLAKKLRQLFESSGDQYLVLGGMNVESIDQPLLKAIKPLPQVRQSRIHMVIVPPSTISSTTEALLKDRNVKVELL